MNTKTPFFYLHQTSSNSGFVRFVPRVLATEPTTQEVYDILGTIIILTAFIASIEYIIALFLPDYDTIFPLVAFTYLMIIFFYFKTKKIRKEQPSHD